MAKKTLEERVERLEAIHHIQNIMSAYLYMHAAGKYRECIQLFTSKTPGCKIEMIWGVYEGMDAPYRCYAVDHVKMGGEYGERQGQMHIQTLTTPIIEIAQDGEYAKGIWVSPGVDSSISDNGKPNSSWAWCKYGCDFVKEDGRWLIWHLHVYNIFTTTYYKSWTEVEPTPVYPTPNQKPDRPSTTSWNYSKEAIYPYDQPWPPGPFETWDDSISYVK